MKFLLALDQGTTSSRALVFSPEGRIMSIVKKELRQYFPQPGWVEQDAREIIDSQCSVARDAISRAGLASTDIAAIGITNQRETTVLWDRRTGDPVHHAIVWQDRRTADHCFRLRREGLDAMIREKSGLVIDPYFSATKIRWLLDHVPGLEDLAKEGHIAFGTVDTWLLWHLSEGKVHATDASNASRTMLMNLATCTWDPELLSLFDIPRTILPEIVDSSGLIGHTRQFGSSIPITGIAGDQQAALFGQQCFAPGMAKNTYGTGCFLLMNTGNRPIPSHNELITTVAWKAAGAVEYALEGSVFTAGALIQWLRDGLGLIRNAAEIEELAGSVPDNGGVYLVPAFSGLGAPHWDPHARGLLIGLTRGTTKGHIARASLEAIAFQVAEILLAMERDSGIPLCALRVDGGACENNLLLQIQADLLGVPVVRPKITETTALGAAALAGLALGWGQNPGFLAEAHDSDRTFQEITSKTDRETALAAWLRAVDRSKHWAAETCR